MFSILKKHPLILFYSSRRGGSTLLAQIIEASSSTGYVDQPFDLWKPDTDRGRIISSYLPHKNKSQFFELSRQEHEQVRTYLKHFYQKKLSHLSTFPKAKHTVLKIVNAHALMDELSIMTPSKSVSLMRHPFSQSLSVLRNKWGTCEVAFLESELWSNKYLTVEQFKYGKNISQNGSYFEKAVLNWCLEWHFPMHYSKTDILNMYYEDLVLNGEKTINDLYNYLGFKGVHKGLKVLNKPSRSSNFSTAATLSGIKSNDKHALLNSWRSQLNDIDLQKGQYILDLFNVKVYSRNSDVPIL